MLLEPGARLDARKLGLIAGAGRPEILAIPRPGVAVVPTGDEVVAIGERPGPGQIRNSNGIMLAGLARAWGAARAEERPIAPDDPEGLGRALASVLGPSDGADVLLVSGGVSAGDKDLVPLALEALGVEAVFHKVRVKPGKPIWFGVGRGRGDRPGPLVFGLPGNPASGLIGFLLFVRPALEALAGRGGTPGPLPSKSLAIPFRHRGDRPTYHPARLEGDRVVPLDWAGSAGPPHGRPGRWICRLPRGRSGLRGGGGGPVPRGPLSNARARGSGGRGGEVGELAVEAGGVLVERGVAGLGVDRERR